ncbi:RimK family alpha-L-glutamate ligase [Streptomyces sp. UNOC14_S4]|uniref:ATP-grasp domain-containing protein n=1 Tax=Streptomyces sp. UNOC14_S4 TaxID=2872340 RepID=UPI001E5EFE1E|nr:alpha-L-glutamate ligase [Streptomyces sp. UNOC14_S4]MCC3772068.1 alpha-L-glutamate ligase [Streptomyces sp. UNOC14_S4]
MRIGLLTPAPDHPLLAATTALLTPHHQVEALDPVHATLPSPARAPESLADVYLLKTRTPRALAFARYLEQHGAPVLNSADATELCQDRTAMADTALAAGLPFAVTGATTTLPRLAARYGLTYPLVVKSRHSRRHDLVAKVDDAAELRALAAQWPDEPVVVQDWTPNDGWDRKLWVVGERVFAALRRSELAAGPRDTEPVRAADLPEQWLDVVRRAGEVFALDVYGVDLIDTPDGPVVVDVNAFPGIRGQQGAPEALAELALRTASGDYRPRGLAIGA